LYILLFTTYKLRQDRNLDKEITVIKVRRSVLKYHINSEEIKILNINVIFNIL